MLNIGFKLWFVLEMKNSFILTYYSQYVNLILFKIAVVTSGCSPEPRYMGNIAGRKKTSSSTTTVTFLYWLISRNSNPNYYVSKLSVSNFPLKLLWVRSWFTTSLSKIQKLSFFAENRELEPIFPRALNRFQKFL